MSPVSESARKKAIAKWFPDPEDLKWFKHFFETSPLIPNLIKAMEKAQMEVTPSQPANCPKCGILMPEPQLKWCPGPSLGNMTKCEHNQRTEHLYQLCQCGYPARIEYVKDHPHDALTDKRKLV